MRINPIVNQLTKATTRNLYDIKLQEAKKNISRRMYVQQIETDYFQRNLKAM